MQHLTAINDTQLVLKERTAESTQHQLRGNHGEKRASLGIKSQLKSKQELEKKGRDIYKHPWERVTSASRRKFADPENKRTLSHILEVDTLNHKLDSLSGKLYTTRALTILAPGPWFVRKIIGQDICHCVESTVVDAQSKSMQLIGFKNYWNDFMMKADTQVFLFRNKTAEHDTIVVCFIGTRPFSADDWCSDADLFWYEFNGIGRIHSGFLKALGIQKNCGGPFNFLALKR
ncbi:triacylglycerol lipase OBL1-like [Hibiscus syriacus]|uniref:triacylglycerol lipase OBL1-like n=1 Tax=Hibiscus syriacus TaxID=106335 RepID=UPI00192165EB|nr:triacylglycerol lipase OBL1-like [Hibiscus syriacus]